MLPAFSAARSSSRAATLIVLGIVVAGSLAACAPEPAPSASTSAPSSAPSDAAPSSPAPTSAEPSATPSDAVAADIELPAACPEIYSPTMLETLNRDTPPLNDPGVTLLTTEITTGLEIIDVAPTIRCSWGQPSGFGLATSVTIVDADQSEVLLQALLDAGLACEDQRGGTLCRIQGDDREGETIVASFGETHFLGGNGWVATHWINVDPEGYSEDIIDTLWG